MCRTLRVLNAVRHPDIGIPLSIQQYKVLLVNDFCILVLISISDNSIEAFLSFVLFFFQSLTPSVLIGRLINAHQHLLALRISEYLGMNQVSYSSELDLVVKVLMGMEYYISCNSF